MSLRSLFTMQDRTAGACSAGRAVLTLAGEDFDALLQERGRRGMPEVVKVAALEARRLVRRAR
ncbi:hypothetical protein [Streptomyces zagrosensis]|uniref:Uncharacterized protein n=1 Tax=Streptomyces zagrosensis TaxID=1042984 RepID=A0A7W9UZM0_9ACTN|nr:hypothetical protein [Streptomyces zagrosensis]MBB5936511.1 hypothetical protein [Streptomyces zagrosensis]